MLVLLGQHSGFDTYAFVNLTPRVTSRCRTSGMAHSESHRWSSVRIRMMFGLELVGDPEIAAAPGKETNAHRSTNGQGPAPPRRAHPHPPPREPTNGPRNR